MLTDVEMLTTAIRMAVDAHAGQLDKCGLPYILHPARVAARLLLETGDLVLTAVGWSHDVIEDCPVTMDVYEAAGFSPRFLVALDAVTHRKGNETHRAYIVRLSMSEDGKVVKHRDIRDNTMPERAYPGSDGMLRKRYLPDWKFLFGHDYDPAVDGR